MARKSISDMIVQAVKDADDAGVKYLGLAHLNKAEFINQGGALTKSQGP